MVFSATQKNKRRSSGASASGPERAAWTVSSGDKGIAVKIRSNSHCRNSCFCGKSSRNAYRSVTRKSLLGE